jgi:hypothetical protein
VYSDNYSSDEDTRFMDINDFKKRQAEDKKKPGKEEEGEGDGEDNYEDEEFQ